MKDLQFTLSLPPFVAGHVADPDRVYPAVEDRMRLVIELSRLNIDHGGGPFGAGVFCVETGRLIAPGVNRVVPVSCSVAHAEMVALILAQQAVGTYNLAESGAYELVTSAEPCAQCFGAIPWSGVRSLAYGADREDVEAIGFDEGPKPPDWIEALRARDIKVFPHVLRQEAAQVLNTYAAAGHTIYNAK